jgi:hypothetical protein
VKLGDWCALWKFANDAENLVLQALEFLNVDICIKFAGLPITVLICVL